MVCHLRGPRFTLCKYQIFGIVLFFSMIYLVQNIKVRAAEELISLLLFEKKGSASPGSSHGLVCL